MTPVRLASALPVVGIRVVVAPIGRTPTETSASLLGLPLGLGTHALLSRWVFSESIWMPAGGGGIHSVEAKREPQGGNIAADAER